MGGSARVEDVVLAPSELVQVPRLVAERAPQIDHEYDSVSVERFLENDVKRRVRHAAAIPEQFAVDARSRQPGRQGTARENVLGRQNLLVVVEEDQRTRLDMGCADRQARL